MLAARIAKITNHDIVIADTPPGWLEEWVAPFSPNGFRLGKESVKVEKVILTKDSITLCSALPWGMLFPTLVVGDLLVLVDPPPQPILTLESPAERVAKLEASCRY